MQFLFTVTNFAVNVFIHISMPNNLLKNSLGVLAKYVSRLFQCTLKDSSKPQKINLIRNQTHPSKQSLYIKSE